MHASRVVKCSSHEGTIEFEVFLDSVFLIIDRPFQVLQFLSVAHVSAPHVESLVSVDCEHRRNLRVDHLCSPWRIHHSKRENQTLVDLGLLVIANHICRDGNHRERVSRTPMNYSQ